MSEEGWLAEVGSAEVHYIPDALKNAADYLLSSRTHGEGWGEYLRFPSDLHATAQAISALKKIQHARVNEIVPRVATWARSQFGVASDKSPQDLIDLLVIADADDDLQAVYSKNLMSRLRGVLSDTDESPLSTLMLAQGILTTESWPDNYRDMFKPWVDELARRSRGVSALEARRVADESILLTCWIVRALSSWQGSSAVDAAINYRMQRLHSYFNERTSDSPEWVGAYPLSLILRALASQPDRESALAREIVHKLNGLQQSDGGWGGGPTEASSVEHTSAAIVALTEIGVCRYVPLTETREVVQKLSRKFDELSTEVIAAREEIERRVEDRLGKVLSDRRRLRRLLQAKEDELNLLRHEIALETSVRYPLAQLRRRSATTFFIIGLPAVAAAAGTVVVILGQKNISVVASVAAASVGILTLAYTFLLQRGLTYRGLEAEQRLTLASRNDVQGLVDKFTAAAADLPHAMREEVVYRLAREAADLPRDLVRRSLSELLQQLSIDKGSRLSLLSWVDEFARIDPSARRAVVVRLRRIVL